MREITPPSTYLPVAGKDLQNLENTADHVLSILKRQFGEEARYDRQMVAVLSADLDRGRQRYTADEESRQQIIWTYGVFLGKAVIESLARGKCFWVDNKVDNFCLKVLMANGEEAFVAPLTRIAKQLADGPEYSMLALFDAVVETQQGGMPQAGAAGGGAARGPSMSAISQQYLAAFRNEEEVPGGLSYRRALGQSNLDGTMESLKRIDALLDQVRTRHAPKHDEFFREPANQNFMYLLAFYVGETIARAAGAQLKWQAYDELVAADPAIANVWPRAFESSIICTFRKPDGSMKQMLPLVPIVIRTFEGADEKSVWFSANGFL